MKNMNQVRDEAAYIYHSLKVDKILPARGRAMIAALDSVLKSVNTGLKYYQLRKEKPNMPFIGPPGKAVKG